jgi:prepilin-type processing-associated H-X9-DG protein
VTYPDANRNGSGGFAWGTFLLPYLEQQVLSHQFNFDLPCWSSANATAARQQVAVFLCPSVTGPKGGFHVIKGDFAGEDPVASQLPFPSAPFFAHTHYTTNAGRVEPWGGPRVDPYAADLSEPAMVNVNGEQVASGIDGPFYRNARVRFTDIRDGLSSTVFIGEHTSILSDKTWVGVIPGAVTCPKTKFRFSSCNAAGALVGAHSGPDPTDLPDVLIHAPNNPHSHTCGMYSEHPRGGHVLFGDGNVRFLQEQIDPFTWSALATINGGDQVGAFE